MKSLQTWMTWIGAKWSKITSRREGAHEQCQRKLNDFIDLAYRPIPEAND